MKFKLVEDFDRGLEIQSSIDALNENKGQTDKRLMVDIINGYSGITINGTDYVLHHLSGRKADPGDRVTSNMLLIPDSPTVSGNAIHKAIHRLARTYSNFRAECEQLQDVKWLYVGTGNQIIPITVEEVIERLVKG